MIDNIIDINYYSFIQSITTVTTKGDIKMKVTLLNEKPRGNNEVEVTLENENGEKGIIIVTGAQADQIFSEQEISDELFAQAVVNSNARALKLKQLQETREEYAREQQERQARSIARVRAFLNGEDL